MEEITNEAVAEKRPSGGARLKKGGNGLLIAVGIAIAAVVLIYIALCVYAGSLRTFYPHRHINGVDVGGLSVAQAQEKLETALLSQTITLTNEETDTSATLTVADLGYTAEDFAGDAQFWKDEDDQRGFLSRGWAYLAIVTGRWSGGAHWPDMDPAALERTADALTQSLSLPAVDSSYELTDNSVRITKAKDGRTPVGLRDALADISAYSLTDYTLSFDSAAVPAKTLTAQAIHDEAAADMKNAGYDPVSQSITPEQLGADFDVSAAQAALDGAAPGETVEIPATIEYPAVTAENLKGVLFRDVLGEASTKVGGMAARKSNVKLSASTINGYVMNSGDVFSYNGVVGQRTAANGYQAAPAYVKGETVDEIGGGICQTSSTLYLACLRGNLAITERYAHRYIPAYIPAGMDATVSWGGPDYKFTNDTDYPIKIVTSYVGDYLTVKILGTNVTGITAKMTNEKLSTTDFQVVYEDDATLAPGTERVKTTPYTGSKWKTYRHLYDANGNLISSAYEATSDYKSRNKVILRGPAKAETTPSTPAAPSTPASSPVETPAQTPETSTPETPATPPEQSPEESTTTIITIPDAPEEAA